jgi:hypothetical protein
MNDINVCCLHFFVPEALGDVGSDGPRLGPRRRGSLVLGETLETEMPAISAAFTSANINSRL